MFNKFILSLLLSISMVSCASVSDTEITKANPSSSKTVVMIHGLFMTNLSWENWKSFFENSGYRVIAPSWPIFQGKTPAEIRKEINKKDLSELKLAEVVKFYENVITKLDEKPIIIGHSMGGLIAQILMSKNLGEAGIAVHPGPPQGVFALNFTFIKNNWPIINPFADVNDPIELSFEDFKETWVHNLDEKEARAAYEKYYIPASRRAAKGALKEDISDIDFNTNRGPLLLISGKEDKIIVDELVRKNYKAYSDSKSITDFKSFDGRTHYTLAQKGWEQVANFSIQWLKGRLGRNVIKDVVSSK